jgi:hypothetical protein
MLTRCSKIIGAVVIAFAMAGCSTGGLLDNKVSATQAASVPVGNPLALPPDLALAAPGETTDAYVSNGPVDLGLDEQTAAQADTQASTSARAAAPRVAAAPQEDVYAKYGISKLNPDGTEKTRPVLAKELKAAILAEKRQTNPNYGTIWNIGSLFD